MSDTPSRGSEPRYVLHDPESVGRDGYPPVWHEIKHEVREAAGNRCARCLHPYEKGAGEWSRCDRECTHGAPYRLVAPGMGVMTVEVDEPEQGVSTWLSHGPVYARWRILTVHHLTGVKYDLRWWNLAALCQRCHLTIQGRVRMERVWPWEHSEWFKPYVAGYYAATYLGEDLTREETIARLDDLLALELVA